MFATIGHTFELMKMSWDVLMKDKELLFFPLFTVIGLVAVISIFSGIAGSTGAFTRLDANAISRGDQILYVLAFFSSYFVVIFFNAALISAALDRLRGGDPNVSSGLSHAFAHIHTIFIWALIAATVGLALQLLRANQRNIFARMIIDMIGGVWDFLTFFVVPILVSENVGAIGAIKRSSGLVRKTWGRQITASFGFMLVYILAVIIGAIPAILVGFVSGIAGVAVGIMTVGLAVCTVQALEGIFKAALYEYAMGEKPAEFDLRTLQTAYKPAPAAQY
ncbi:MAG: hypothetical protein HOE50_02870 [Chloroflexi bacterium]|jgi:hypothetical protein|nr:hypothetical protein [Chloroflexota bacterium]MBT3862322.1 hypothetical protein [Chloroflexota bacterium]MBT4142067.1 hypothetical protein [Chloroflexota bacterium]MBT4341051.1 hypothetical protein [Chloroflexota bacterium]MBT4942964.1 hypothetical protein [Chloroflexota bacterium]|tara:strand:- start:111 stop:944 length:834 start_codon:yes stop_codon:yes gene_type:complete